MSDVVTTMSFPRFASLPPEIRLLIWEFTLEQRKLHVHVAVKTAKLPSVDGHRNFGISDVAFVTGRSSGPPAVALWVCQESRNLLLPRYPWILQDQIKASIRLERRFNNWMRGHDNCHFRHAVKSRRGAMINFELDTVELLLQDANAETFKLMSPLTLLGKFGTKQEIEKIKRLKFSAQVWDWAEAGEGFEEALGAFRGLEEICVKAGEKCTVCHYDHYGSGEKNKKKIEKVCSEVKQVTDGWKMPKIKATIWCEKNNIGR